ncbi:GNAT family N-acetyltransferase [Chitinophaga filiformis]|uniref:N-acetyltransferase domain-containing protein n=1 Tax=Chitinophaga filiformis TaxID=104663 RepID=A0ABY4HVW5_CHIFI|nr:GNAT family N-acetyltransferase [Chitinophaga filiformis]UPK67940.1 hypothetical protein MYF79_23595 [Chitinophaga filiformis]
MSWSSFNTYGDSPNNAFETLCNHLFRNYIFRNYKDIVKFRAVNGKGGDGGVESYAEFADGAIRAVQSKWFRDDFGASQIDQIRKSINTAKKLRPNIKEYFVCIPRKLTSLRFVRGSAGADKQVTRSSEDQLLDELDAELKGKFADLTVHWWVDEVIEAELMREDNEGLHKFWFSHEVINVTYLQQQFERQKAGWLNERYVPQLHTQGFIQQDIAVLNYSETYRNHFSAVAKYYVIALQRVVTAIDKFLKQEFDDETFRSDLVDARSEIIQTIGIIKDLEKKVKTGQLVDPIPVIPFDSLDKLIDSCVNFGYDHQGVVKADFLINAMLRLKDTDFEEEILRLKGAMDTKGLLILGGPGTGKTHGLAFAVEQHLQRQAPAMIIQAFGTPCNSWGEIISAGLELTNWSINEILNALESIAIRNDRRLADSMVSFGEELNREPTPVLINVDGLEEDLTNWRKWNTRIRESLLIGKKFPRVKFIYSARPQFFKSSELPDTLPLNVHELPAEGDVRLQKLALHYFTPENYNITITSPSLIRGLDSLFALRLFCEIYRNRSLSESDQLITAGKDLLAGKIGKMESEFQVKMGTQFAESRSPVATAISVLAGQFLEKVEIEHNFLVQCLQPELTYMTVADIDQLLDYLAHSGILIKNVSYNDADGIPISKTEYYITYRSIIEIVVANRTIKTIISENLEQIPALIFERLRLGTGQEQELSNERITQIIVNTMFHEHGKLIGEEGFLTKGFTDLEIQRMRTEALRKAPAALAAKYKAGIDKQFWESHEQRYKLLLQQILPGSENAENNFGAFYLHQILISIPNAYQRDKIWNGKDYYGYPKEISCQYGVKEIIDTYSQDLYLSDYALHNEMPLVYAWCLSTLDQKFRERLRKNLARWAISQPNEFILLLDLIFDCKDPQIQEDLASITLALAGRLKDQQAIFKLAQWALNHVFNDPLTNRNIIVRQGFRAIVERAYQYQLITDEEVALCRPQQQNDLILLSLDNGALTSPREEIYPIVHDLAWYVVKKSTNGFLKYPDGSGPVLQSKDSPQAQQLLDLYAQKYGVRLYASGWRMAAAIAYVRGLGFDAVDGSSFTEASHGSKSKIFTYEEKYTWLAVHYLNGYLADYVPYNKDETWGFIKDYNTIINVPNPAEDLVAETDQPEVFDEWIQQEPIFAVLNDEPSLLIEAQVTQDPVIDFGKWLHFNETQFYLSETDEDLVALYNYTSTHDNTGFVYGRMQISACLVPKGAVSRLLKVLQNDRRDPYFVTHLDNLHASPDTDIYSNPSDLVWMNWIEERETGEAIPIEGEKLTIGFALTGVTKNSTEGEEHLMIPSRLLRNITGMVEMQGSFFFDKQEKITAFLHKVSLWQRENQEIVVVNKQALQNALDENNLEMVWFVEQFKAREVSVPEIEHVPHFQKCRKYFVYQEDGELKDIKFWDERFSNQRDKYSDERFNALVPEIKQYNQFSEDEIRQIESLIKAGGEVNARTLSGRLKSTEAIAVFKADDRIVATASIKKPLTRYRNYVFTQAKVPDKGVEYDLELGYVYTKTRYRGHRLARRLCQSLIGQFEQHSIYATTRMTNMPMYFVLTGLGFRTIGETYENKEGTDQLSLCIRKPKSNPLVTDADK